MTITNNNDENDSKVMTRSQKQASTRNKSIKKRHTKPDSSVNKNKQTAPEHIISFPRIIIPEQLLRQSKKLDDDCNFSRTEEKYLMSIKDKEKDDIIARMKKFSETIIHAYANQLPADLLRKRSKKYSISSQGSQYAEVINRM